MTYLALDIGAKRVGVAVGNTELRLATPLAVFARKRIAADAAQVASLAARYEAAGVVVGLPHELDGSIGAQAEAVMAYVERLRRELTLPIEFHDERYSTAAALAHRREIGVSVKRGRATLDAAAAAVILQDFLDSKIPAPRPGPAPSENGERA